MLNWSLTEMIGDEKRARPLSVAIIAFLEGISLFAVILERKEYPVENVLEECRILFREFIDSEKKSEGLPVKHGKKSI